MAMDAEDQMGGKEWFRDQGVPLLRTYPLVDIVYTTYLAPANDDCGSPPMAAGDDWKKK
jgi:hypothetical protein